MSKMKIYFCGSIRGGRQDVGLYAKIIETLGSYGEVLTEHVGDAKKNENLDDKGIHDRDVAWLKQCDALVAEVTQPSMGVGYELGRAVAMGKKILCLFRPNTDKLISALVEGAHNGSSFVVKHYKVEDYPGILKEVFDKLSINDSDCEVATKRMKMDENEGKENVESAESKERKIYFCGSIRGGRQDAGLYAKIIAEMKREYGPVLTEVVGYENPVLPGEDKMTDEKIHEIDMAWLQESTELVAEVTQVSTGVGYEIGRAVEMDKKIMCLFRPDTVQRISAMISGAHNGTSFTVKGYKDQEYSAILKEFFKQSLCQDGPRDSQNGNQGQTVEEEEDNKEMEK